MAAVTVIVPAYNAEQYISRCLISILNQTLSDLEIIVVNDGSTDKTKDIVMGFAKKDQRIVLINQENLGLAGARNTGLNKASGKYIGFVDSDDWIESEFYEKLYRTCEDENADVSCGICIRTNNERKNWVNNRKSKKLIFFDEEILIQFLEGAIRGCSEDLSVCTKLYRRSAIQNVMFDEGRIYEDVFFNWRTLSKITKYIKQTNCRYYYFATQNSITTQVFTKKRFDLKYAQSRIKNDYKGDNKRIIFLIDQYRARIDFSLLCKMIQFKYDDTDSLKKQLETVKKEFSILFDSNITLNRKAILTLFKVMDIDTILLLSKLYYLRKR